MSEAEHTDNADGIYAGQQLGRVQHLPHIVIIQGTLRGDIAARYYRSQIRATQKHGHADEPPPSGNEADRINEINTSIPRHRYRSF